LRFHRGDYAGAVGDLDAAGERGELREDAERAQLAALIRATRESTAHFRRVASADGRYVVLHAPGADEVLVPYALSVLEAADRAASAELGFRVPGPIRLEVYPSAASLSQVSSLSVREIATTGTVALCKWDRLMITTPRALVRGYPWADTVAHELIHLVLSRASRDRAPVWLQEGTARFLERRWRGGPPQARLDPASETLLQRAAREGELLPFDRLHPSIARLPSQQDAALAFAQVATFVERFHQHHGAEGLRRAVQLVAAGTDARAALAQVSGESFDALERAWRGSIGQRPPPRGLPRILALRLRQGEGELDESADVEEERARRHLRLGDLLWHRDRFAAAAAEYERARAASPDDPIVASRNARAALLGGRPAQAVEALARARELHPEHAPTWAISGAAWLALGNRATAREALREAILINPFDPQPHCDLAEASSDAAERGLEGATCSRLRGSPSR
jgi:tetratricopeptide (TPR) repeat protein